MKMWNAFHRDGGDKMVKAEIAGRRNASRFFRVLELILVVCLLAAVVHYGYRIFTKLNPYGMNSDVSDEISYRQACWEQKTLFPKGFVCSGESFAGRPVLLYGLFYGMTHNFLLAYQLEAFCTLLLLLGSLYYLMKKISCGRTARLAGLLLFAVGLSVDIQYVCIWPMNCYVLYVITILLTLAARVTLREGFQKRDMRRCWPSLVLVLALSAIFGFGTIKLLALLYLPLLLLDGGRVVFKYLTRRPQDPAELRMMLTTVVLILVNMIAFVLFRHIYPNNIAPADFVIAGVDRQLSWELLSSQMQTVATIFGSLGTGLYSPNFGQRGVGRLVSAQGVLFVFNAALILIEVVAVVWIFRKKTTEGNEQGEIAWYWLASLAIMFVYQIVLGLRGTQRYYCMAPILLSVLCACAINDWMDRGGGKISPVPCAVASLVAMCVFLANVQLDIAHFSTAPAPIVQVANYIDENGYRYVAAAWANAGQIKGYTNGRVEYLHGADYGGITTLSPSYYMIDTNKFTQEYLGVPGILLLTDEEETQAFTQNSYTALLLNEYAQKVQEIDVYNLYAVTENPFTLVEKLKRERTAGLPTAEQTEKTDRPGNVGFSFLNNAALNEDGELVSDGATGGIILYGPYSDTVPGVYDITLNYTVETAADASEGTFDVALDTHPYVATAIPADQTSVTLEDVSIEAGHQFEARVSVPVGMVIRVQSIHYTRVG